MTCLRTKRKIWMNLDARLKQTSWFSRLDKTKSKELPNEWRKAETRNLTRRNTLKKSWRSCFSSTWGELTYSKTSSPRTTSFQLTLIGLRRFWPKFRLKILKKTLTWTPLPSTSCPHANWPPASPSHSPSLYSFASPRPSSCYAWTPSPYSL